MFFCIVLHFAQYSVVQGTRTILPNGLVFKSVHGIKNDNKLTLQIQNSIARKYGWIKYHVV